MLPVVGRCRLPSTMEGAVMEPVDGSGKNTLQWSEGPELTNPLSAGPPSVTLRKPGLNSRMAVTVRFRMAKSWRTTVPGSINWSPGSRAASQPPVQHASRSRQRPWLVFQEAEISELLCKASPVGGIDPGHDSGPVLLFIRSASTSEHRFTRGQLPDSDGLDVAGML